MIISRNPKTKNFRWIYYYNVYSNVFVCVCECDRMYMKTFRRPNHLNWLSTPSPAFYYIHKTCCLLNQTKWIESILKTKHNGTMLKCWKRSGEVFMGKSFSIKIAVFVFIGYNNDITFRIKKKQKETFLSLFFVV